MPALAKRLLIAASANGLIIRPASSSKDDRSRNAVLTYGTGKITSESRNEDDDAFSSPLEAHGLVGILDLVSTTNLIVITRREQVASIRSKAIYAVRDVTLIPLTSQAEAEKAIGAAQKSLAKAAGAAAGVDTDESEVEDDADNASIASASGDEEASKDAAALEPPKVEVKKSTSFAKNVVQSKGGYGRFAQMWFSKNGSKAGVGRKQGLTDEENSPAEEMIAENDNAQGDTKDPAQGTAEPGRQDGGPSTGDGKSANDANEVQKVAQGESDIESLTPRILRTARLFFSTSGFFFSYDHDLSGTLTQKAILTSDLPLWKRFDSLYFWNRHLIDPLIEASHDELVIPLMQGFVGQRAFSIAKTERDEKDAVAGAAQEAEKVVGAQATPSKTEITDDGIEACEFLLTLISRRSVKRAGLRYMRRGVDDDGNVANTVETEQIVSPVTWDISDKTYSLLQLRGSIPLHFTQNPGSLKPTPLMFGSEATNQAAFRKHLMAVSSRYGQIQVVSLIDKHNSPEVPIGEAYEAHAKHLNDGGGINGRPVGFEWFDFHGICKGMKFENVSILMDSLESTLKSFGWIVKQNDRNVGLQSGVIRTNCMDCLDRTNVVQSAIAGWAIEQQLKDQGLHIDLKTDPKTQWFNTLWADNGDAISKQYAGTAALKGDFTRTRKRNWTGALSDFSLTMTRYYNNMFGDYFLQTCIDYYLGNDGPGVFEEFETDMMSKDYSLNVRRTRESAIDTCVKIVLEDPNGELVAGWTLSCPKESNTLRSLPFEECVVLLTTTAFYFCRFDWDTEKVGGYEKVDLRDVIEIWRGVYITSALGGTHLDETKNYGFALRYSTAGKSVVRRNTRTLNNEGEATDENEGKDELEKQAEPDKDQARLLAFKALPPSSSAAKDDNHGVERRSEVELIAHICGQVQQATTAARAKGGSDGSDGAESTLLVEEKYVISVADAKKSTGYVESLGYSLKRMVWS